jgi:hypothetical protein
MMRKYNRKTLTWKKDIPKRNAERHPDYFFGRCPMAQIAIRDKKYEEAKERLAQLLEQTRFHLSEFRALSHAYLS